MTPVQRAPTYSAAIVSSRTDVRRLGPSISRLMPDGEVTLEPEFFLASISDQWIPRVAVVHRNDVVVGVVYGKERRIAGLPTGIVYVDGRLGDMVAADAFDRNDVIRVAIQAMFAMPGIRGLRLSIPSAGLEAAAVARAADFAPVDVGYSSTGLYPHALLPLPADYPEFLRLLGRDTRQNFRRYPQKFAAAGHRFEADLSPQDVERAVVALIAKSHIRDSRGQTRRALNVLAAADRPWGVGLRHQNGQWLSVGAGWYSSDRAIMFLQMNNDREHRDASLSVVLRAHLIETLIGRKKRQLVFWAGSSPPLSRYAETIPAIRVHLDTRTLGWRTIRSMIGLAIPCLPRKIGEDLNWIVCARTHAEQLAPSEEAGG